MWKSISIIVLAFSIVEACTYKNRECAPYTVDEEHTDYEIRSYPHLTWITTTEESSLNRIAQYKAFMRLFGYITGKNDRSLNINMTVPVRIQKTEDGDKTKIEMHFMVPSEIASNPPVPNDKRILIFKEGPSKYAVRSFSGYVWRQATWAEEAEKLASSLFADDTVDKSQYYQVGYDSPQTLFDRRNEIWMRKKGAEEANEI